ncbi:sulfatase [Allorhodopirellula solitaria]|uniref:Arylsulfatase n=1 Tax=Allorhodopirellula solitaria TaxID=2527987 RepID=A0A5C5XWR2_9BACT|nr:sulfatase [Allorhodopirellula solitaria]TWT66042.1 Arylsulfatase [Allorhodopirellula solitaria]
MNVLSLAQVYKTTATRWTSVCVTIFLVATLRNQANAERPHIVYINADDLGVMDVGYNDPKFRTPHIDRLAQEGMVFTSAYAPAANCAPSRACVHSGQWSPRHGVYTVGSSERGKAKTRRLIPIENTSFLDADCVTLAEALQADGYRTIHLGKYHIGKDPLQDGFDVNIGGDASGSPSGGYYSPWKKGAMADWTDAVDANTHRVDVFAQEAVEFMQDNHASPMFIHFSPYLVHSPLTPVPEYVDNYQGSELNAKYASMVEKIDEAIGRVLDAIERLELTESTLVVFSSDNGGIAAFHSQRPLRGGKGSYYEGGVREPLVMRWPGKIQPGSTCDEAVNTMDFYPTFLEAAGIRLPTAESLDGVSLMPLMTESGPWDPVPQFWHFPVYLQAYDGALDDARDPLFRTRPGSAMRTGKWKLHEYFEDGALELYDLSSDPGERHDLSDTMPEQTAELHELLMRWRNQTGAPVPSQANPKYDAEFERRAIEKVQATK